MAANVVRLRLFGADIVVTTAEEPSHNSLGGSTPNLVSSDSGGVAPGLLEEEHVQDQDVQKGAKFCTIADHVDTSMMKLSNVDNDDADNSLKLSTAVPRNPDPPVLCPVPLQSVPPAGIVPEADSCVKGYDSNDVDQISAPDDDHQVDKTVSLMRHAAGSGIGGENRGKSRKRRGGKVCDDDDGEKGARSVKRKRDDDQNLHPIPSLEDIPGLLQVIESRNGTSPVFLYRKKLKGSDVSGHYNRLFLTKREKFMLFLNDEETKALDPSSQGLKILAVDRQGALYKLGLKMWKSLKMIVVNSDWNKLVVQNDARKGDWIEMWGYREKEKLRLAVIFRKSDEASGSGSSGSNGGGTSQV